MLKSMHRGLASYRWKVIEELVQRLTGLEIVE